MTMKMRRRDGLKAAGAAGAAVALGGCEQPVLNLAEELAGALPDELGTGEGGGIDPAFHLLSRAAYGPWPGDVARVRKMGEEKWLDKQLNPRDIADISCDLRTGGFNSLLFSPGAAYEFRKNVIREEITRHSLLRAIYSRRQLFEVMVGFWTDHLNINLEKGDCIYLKPSDDRDVVRRHALGTFRDLIRASMTSPAMLVYLDGNSNMVREGKDEPPNENYARELLELHTMGAGRGYTQDDIYQAALCLSGWRFETKGIWRGAVRFHPELHHDGEKTVLGEKIAAGGGEKDIDSLVDIVCARRETAEYLAGKLCGRFISEDPPADTVAAIADTFQSTKGDIRKVVRAIFQSDAYHGSAGKLIKRPFRFVASALRGAAAQTSVQQPVVDYLLRLGHAPFQHPTPDGYPDEPLPWMGGLLWRWNFATDLAEGDLGSVSVPAEKMAKRLGEEKEERAPRLFRHLCGRDPSEKELAALLGVEGRGMLSLALASPAFQTH